MRETMVPSSPGKLIFINWYDGERKWKRRRMNYYVETKDQANIARRFAIMNNRFSLKRSIISVNGYSHLRIVDIDQSPRFSIPCIKFPLADNYWQTS